MKDALERCRTEIQNEISRVLNLQNYKIPTKTVVKRDINSEDHYEESNEKKVIILDFNVDKRNKSECHFPERAWPWIMSEFYKKNGNSECCFSECVLLDLLEKKIVHTDMYYVENYFTGILGIYPIWENNKYIQDNPEDWLKYHGKILEELGRIK